MQEKIREIIAAFTKVPLDSIHPGTVIDRSALKSSIILHRMYARLAEEGIVMENYSDIRTVGDLFRVTATVVNDVTDSLWVIKPQREFQADGSFPTSQPGIGLDVEEIGSMPVTGDFREDQFYKMNFTAAEIAYCILQPDSYSSFTGLFAAKEAIIKSDGRYRSKIFNSIEISHSPEGKPEHPGYNLSISHAGKMAVAVAVPSGQGISGGVADLLQASPMPVKQLPVSGRKDSLSLWLAMLALVFSAIAMILVLIH